MLWKKSKRAIQQVNAGSMADIAFLLLIFFLVTTTITMDKGIKVKLPPLDIRTEPFPIPPRNVLSVKVNYQDELLVEGEEMKIVALKDAVVEFILNPQQQMDLADSPKKAVVSLQNDRSTSYKAYIAVYNELKAAYNHIWNEQALSRYGKSYESLDLSFKKLVRKDFPLVISEADPTDIAQVKE